MGRRRSESLTRAFVAEEAPEPLELAARLRPAFAARRGGGGGLAALGERRA
jgi:hypothetical protein